LARFALAVVFAVVAVKLTGVPGQVRDDHGPVAGVCVRFKGTNHRATTDADGRFDLNGSGTRVTASKPGFFINGVPVADGLITLRLRPLPTTDNSDYVWVNPNPSKDRPQNCGNCHGEIFREWAGSAHGGAGRNRRFVNLYDGTDWQGRPNAGWNLLKEHPDGASVCAACHAPTVPFDHGGFEDFRKLDGVHARGVHCDYCHKISEVSTDKLGLEHGRFAHKLLRPAKGQLFFGPLDDVDRDEDSHAPFYSESRYCASCHEGTVFGVKVYTTYSEWLESPARKQGKHCQSCHMTPTGKMDNIAPGNGGIKREPATLASHAMSGGDKTMLERCLRLTVKLRHKKDELVADVATLATDVGHRVPTGFIDRNLLLVIEALSAKGERLSPNKGPTLPDCAGRLAKLPGKFFAKQIEDPVGQKPIPFWRPSRDFADSRLRPDQPDNTEWHFADQAANKVRVRLIYRRFFEAVAQTKGWPDNEIVVVDETLAVPGEAQEIEKRFPTVR
jgi:hypothetical protein